MSHAMSHLLSPSFANSATFPDTELLRDVLDVTPSGLVLCLPVYNAAEELIDFTFAYLNPAAQRMLRLPAGHTSSYLQQFPESQLNGSLAFYRTTFLSGEPGTIETDCQGVGYNNYFRVTARRSGAGLLVSFTHSDQALQLAQTNTEQQTQQLNRLFMETPAAICIHRGPEHRYEYLNATYQALFPDRPLLGRLVVEALPETVLDGTVAILDEVYQTGVTFFGNEVPLTIAQVGSRPAHDRFFTFTHQAYRENGVVVGIFTFAYDMTEQVLGRQAHEVERQRMLSLFMQAPAGICILTGPELIFEFTNPGYHTLMRDRLLEGRPILEALPELVGSPVAALLRGVYESGQTHEEKSLHIALARPTDGVLEDRYFSIVYQARRDEHGQVDGILVFAFEVTEQAQARQAVETSARQAQTLADELRESNEQLTRTNVDLDTFIYTASHDLNAPISNIEGLLFRLQCELPAQSLTGQVPRILDLMQDSVERFKKTIEHLTAVSRLQKEYDQSIGLVALASVIEDVRLDLVPLLLQTNGHLVVDVRDVPTVTCSEKNLRSIVYNLLSNALKYRHPDRTPQVRLHARLETAYVVIEVQDNGLGLALTADTQIFTMFQRFHTHVEGSGVGLYMVKRMVENAGGKIEVQSQIDEGSTFSVYLKR